ncbi:MAG TPA: HYExAFE family protein [Anaerohalosphaeraceae bacterium]|nr:HYExAFE family protein [Anaerohalosphaeraceae bacterium]HOL30684.1 HYExAFE family protein [Anaerohalosphaeraceae bacterium]HOM76464.1 HYExAFE family protein [Anaerohalosphaeraceae bacterium]HPC63416.1 HYExAFE family protein [Anaerohalosphaeraceae bacterium]HPO71068.1 HYExAFE family protein [Anaerohalosphaeraceae bacterium]
MGSGAANIYEQAFKFWLEENHIPFVQINQTKRLSGSTIGVKNFDFLLNPAASSPILAEVKGRTFHGKSLAGLKGLDCWTTLEDVQALSHWQQVFVSETQKAQAVFVFVFQLKQIDIETDGWPIYDCLERRFLLVAISVHAYLRQMKPRSGRWNTVTLPAADFRRHAVPAGKLLLTPDDLER